MNITFITVGKPKLAFAQSGFAEYQKRIGRFASVKTFHLKEDKSLESNIAKHCEKKFIILLDEKGKLLSSKELAVFLETKRNQSIDLAFVVGGADGHSDALKKQADMLWSLSPLTFPHDVAMMLTLETLYRSLSIVAGHPYHRA